jgi:hypothetical protein
MKKLIALLLFVFTAANADVVIGPAANPAGSGSMGGVTASSGATGTGQACITTSTNSCAWTAVSGSGTVTSTSVVTANGLAGTVTNPTATPAITLSTTVTGVLKGDGTSISAATPGTDYVTPSGNISGTAGTVTTNANLTGPVTSVGNATSVTNNAITNAMTAQMPTLTVKGNATGSTANAADLTASQAKTLLAIVPDDLPFPSTGVAESVRSVMCDTASAGWITGGAVTDIGSAQVSVGSGEAILRSSNTSDASCYYVAWTAVPMHQTVSDVDEYVYVSYNSGSPAVVFGTTEPTDTNTNIILAEVHNTSNVLAIHFIPRVLGNFVDVVSEWVRDAIGNLVISGGLFFDPATPSLKVAITSADARSYNLTTETIPSFNSNAGGTFTTYWGLNAENSSPGNTDLDATQYDNAGTLTALTTSYYTNRCILITYTGQVGVIYDQAQYATLADAQAADCPAILPSQWGFDLHSVRIAQITVQQGHTTYLSYIDIRPRIGTTNTLVSGGGATVVNHNDLAGIQGGQAGQYWHLNTAEHSEVQALNALSANSVAGNATASSGGATALAMPSCSTSGSALNYTTSSGFSCNTAVAASTVVTNANLTGNVTSVGNATTITSIPAVSGAALTGLTAANISAGTAGIDITGNSSTATSAATLTAGRTIGITGDVTYTSPSFNGSANVTNSSTVTGVNGTALSGLGTGLLKNTTGTGIPSIAVANTDYTPVAMGAVGDMIYGGVAGAATRLAGNTTTEQLVLTQVGDGVNSAAPSWQPLPVGGYLTYYFQGAASDVATYYKQLVSPFATSTALSTAGVANAQVLANYITDPGFPGVAFVPGGVYQLNLHASQTAGSKVSAVYAELWETTSAGVDIALIGTSGFSQTLTGSAADDYVTFSLAAPYTMASSSSRIDTRIRASVTGGGSAPTIALWYGGATDSRTQLPSNQVDASNFIPYTGATANIDLGSHTITSPSFLGNATSATNQSGGTVAATTISSSSTATLARALINGSNTTQLQQLNVAGSITFDANSLAAQTINTALTGGASTTVMRGISAVPTFTPTATGTTAVGILTQPTIDNGASFTSVAGNNSTVVLSANALGGTIVNAAAYTGIFTPNALATTGVTTFTQFLANDVVNGALQTVSSAKSFTGQMQSGTGRYNLYMSGTAPNYLNADLMIGSATDNGVDKLQITGSQTTTGQIKSTLATGTAPLLIASTTNVANLNASSLNGATFAAPGAVGSGTASTGAFTTLSSSGLSNLNFLEVNGTNTTLAAMASIDGTSTYNFSDIVGLQVAGTYTGGLATTGLYGIYSGPTFTPTAVVQAEYGTFSLLTHNSGNAPIRLTATASLVDLGSAALGGTTSSAQSYLAFSPILAAAATTNITTYSGFTAQSASNGAAQSIANVYGFEGQQVSGTNRWNLYMSGTAINYLNGALLIGSATDNGVDKLQVTGTTTHTGQIKSTLATGTAPFVVASTTNVANLNASSLSGATFATPGAIGSGTASTGAFTTLGVTGKLTSTSPTGSTNSASFVGTTTGANYINFQSTTGLAYLGIEASSAGSIFSGSSAYATVLQAGPATALDLGSNNSIHAILDSAGTFSVPLGIINTPIGATTPTTGAFTTLSASSTVSGTGFSTYLASPPAIGGTTASTGRFTTVTSTIATGTAPFTVASTTNVANLNASSLGGATFAAPGAIGGTTASTGKFTTLTETALLISNAAPTISSGFGTTPSISSNNGTAAFRVNVGTGGTATSGVIGLPAATTGWNCWANDITTNASFVVGQTASTTTTATLANYSRTTGASIAWTASDILAVSCFAY